MKIYFIGEAFLNLDGFENWKLKEYGEQIVRLVTKGTDIPISMGIVPTQKLAKGANKFTEKLSKL